jgi:teichuronic acid biosynthesis protein TuaE
MILFLRFLGQRQTAVYRYKKVSNYILFYIFWAFYALLSLLWAVDKNGAILNIIFLNTGILCVFLIVYYFKDINSMNRIFKIWSIAFIIMIGIGIWEILTGHHLTGSIYSGPINIIFRYLPAAVFHNTNDFATFISISLPIILIGISQIIKSLRWYVGTAVFIIAIYVLTNTESGSNFVALILEMTFWFFFLLKAISRIKIIIIIIIASLLIFSFYSDIAQTALNKVTQQFNTIPTDLAEGSIRRSLYLNGLYFAIESYGFGVGAGNEEYYMENSPIYQAVGIHNWMLEILVNYGIWVFIGYLFLYFGLLRSLYQIYRKSKFPQYKLAAQGLMASMVGFSVASLSSSSIISFIPQWLLFACALALVNIARQK